MVSCCCSRKQAEEHQRLIIGELEHRTGNLFSVIQAIISNTLKDAKTNGRVKASQAYTLLAQHGKARRWPSSLAASPFWSPTRPGGVRASHAGSQTNSDCDVLGKIFSEYAVHRTLSVPRRRIDALRTVRRTPGIRARRRRFAVARFRPGLRNKNLAPPWTRYRPGLPLADPTRGAERSRH
jgi:hypothetical protein